SSFVEDTAWVPWRGASVTEVRVHIHFWIRPSPRPLSLPRETAISGDDLRVGRSVGCSCRTTPRPTEELAGGTPLMPLQLRLAGQTVGRGAPNTACLRRQCSPHRRPTHRPRASVRSPHHVDCA